MTPIMTPFLVRVRIPDLNPPDQGAMRLYIAVCETEAQAMEATKKAGRSNWQVEASLARPSPNWSNELILSHSTPFRSRNRRTSANWPT